MVSFSFFSFPIFFALGLTKKSPSSASLCGDSKKSKKGKIQQKKSKIEKKERLWRRIIIGLKLSHQSY